MPFTVTVAPVSEGWTGNFVLSSDSSRLYLTGADGVLRIYDTTTGALISSVTLGGYLRAVDISADGSFVVVTSSTPVTVNGVATSNFYRVDTTTLAVQTTGIQTNTGLFDIVLSSTNRAIITDWGASSWNTVYAVDLSSGVATAASILYFGNLTVSADHSRILGGQMGLSGPSGLYYTVDPSGNTITGSPPVSSFTNSRTVEAVSPNGDRMAIAANFGVLIFDGNFVYLTGLTSMGGNGLTFNADGSILYGISDINDTIVGVRMSDFAVVETINLPAGSYYSAQDSHLGSAFGQELLLSADGGTFFVNTPAGILAVERTNVNFGTSGDDFFNGVAYQDEYSGLDGNDIINGGGGNDTLDGGDGADTLDGGDGDDLIDGGAGNNALIGGVGTDTLRVSASGSVASISGFEALELVGGANLTLTGTQFANGFAKTTAVSGTGSLTVNMDAGVNFLSQQFAFAGSGVTVTVNGTSGNDVMKLGRMTHVVNAGDGNDQIRGGTAADTINGGDGNDKIIGFTGADVITGGSGNDQFRYLFHADSGLGAAADWITDFTIGGDRLNFLLIDADAVTAGDQAFNFVGTAAFANTGVGQIRYQNSGADLLVQADVNGDGVADMEIILQGRAGGTLTAADFIL